MLYWVKIPGYSIELDVGKDAGDELENRRIVLDIAGDRGVGVDSPQHAAAIELLTRLRRDGAGIGGIACWGPSRGERFEVPGMDLGSLRSALGEVPVFSYLSERAAAPAGDYDDPYWKQ